MGGHRVRKAKLGRGLTDAALYSVTLGDLLLDIFGGYHQVADSTLAGTRRISLPVWSYDLKGCQPLRSYLAGPVTRSQASDETYGGPTGSAAPATQPLRDLDLPHRCDFPGCHRSFSKKTGLGVHQQKAHTEWYESRLAPAAKKIRWSDEEGALLARKEAQLTISGVRLMNQELVKIFPNRSLESIKGRRRGLTHRNLVAQFIREMEQTDDVESDDEPSIQPDDSMFLEYIRTLPRIDGKDFQATKLQNICDSLGDSTKDAILQDLALYLLEIFPTPTARNPKRERTTKPAPPMRKRIARRKEYAMTQLLWRKSRTRCVQSLLSDIGDVHTPPQGVMEPFWKEIITSSDESVPPPVRAQPPVLGIWTPIAPEDIKVSRPSLNTAAGPDGLTARQFRAVPSGIIARIFNVFLWCRRIPEHLLRSRTIFIPKTKDAADPSEFRPISIPSIITRSFHKILAKRLAAKVYIDERQRAFTNTDGCRDNIFLLDAILRYHHKRYKPLYLASLDISKAFDSVSHPALISTLETLGVPSAMVEYMRFTYSRSTTRLQGDNWSSAYIKPKRGVRQGDPLSPIIFNMITHRLLQSLPSDIGVRMGDTPLNASAFADDIILFATTAKGLQILIDHTADFFKTCGMTINTVKSLTVGIKASPKDKKTAIDITTTFQCDGRQLPCLRRNNEWKYLGIKFNPGGRRKTNPFAIIGPDLETLTKAPLKPQQRLFALKHYVIPKAYYQLALGDVTIGQLNKTDILVRAAIRKWMNLPSDTTNAYFHSNVADGGLGIPSLRWSAPLQRLYRLESLKKFQPSTAARADDFLHDEISSTTRRLSDNGRILKTKAEVCRRWASLLHQSVDGSALKDSSKTPTQHRWISEGTRFLTGRDYINCCRLRIGALPTRSRTTRGRFEDRRCRAGCTAPETLNHVLQQCHRTHPSRIARHDAIVAYLARNLRRQGYTVNIEPKFATTEGTRKPDVVAHLGRTAIVLDAQVNSEQTDLDASHEKKIRYYSRNRSLDDLVKQSTLATEVVYLSATLSCRGIWSSLSAMKLLGLGIIKKRDLTVLSSRVLIGGIAAFRFFNRDTTVVRGDRVGVG